MERILFIDRPHPYLEEGLREMGFSCDADLTGTKREIEQKLKQYTGVVMRSRINADESFIDHAKHLRFIAREGVGVEHIAVDYARSMGIAVLNSPEGSRDTVAEHAMGLLLMLMNNLGRADREVRQGKWIREANRGTELCEKTVGIIGYGNMGTAFAKRLSGFGVRVLAYDKYLRGYGDAYAREAGLKEVFSEADVVSLHIPYFADNHHFADDEFFRNFQKEIYLINTARGLVLDTAALVRAMKSGKVKGAALDVLEYEEQSFDRFRLDDIPADLKFLQNSPNVVLSPHIAGWSFESKRKHAEVLLRKIRNLMDQ